jgi:hypothetical protein
MKTDLWYDAFLDAIQEKFPKKSQLIDALMDLLNIEREAAYRRLRKDVLFSIYEVTKIAYAWGISLDAIINNTPDHSHSLRLKLLNFFYPTELDLREMEDFVQSLENLKNVQESEYMEVSNQLPGSLFSGFPHLARFYLFKWMYRYGHEEVMHPYSQVMQPDRLRKLEIAHFEGIRNISDVFYIWDNKIIEYLINDIKYFASIYLISPEDIQILKDDINAFLDFMEDVSNNSCFPNGKGRVHLYVSRTNIDTGYSYFSSETRKVSLIRTFILNVASTTNEQVFDNLKMWINRTKRSSVKISSVDEKRRIVFFKEQRELVNTLDNSFIYIPKS